MIQIYPPEKIYEEMNNQNRLAKQSLEKKRRLEKSSRRGSRALTSIVIIKNKYVSCMTFLQQYETSEQLWKYEPIDDQIDPINHPIPHWNLMSTSELANLAHFPTKEVKTERLETSSTKQSLPPDSYIID